MSSIDFHRIRGDKSCWGQQDLGGTNSAGSRPFERWQLVKISPKKFSFWVKNHLLSDGEKKISNYLLSDVSRWRLSKNFRKKIFVRNFQDPQKKNRGVPKLFFFLQNKNEVL